MKRKPLKACAGANVIFGGHRGYFIADVRIVGDTAVVVASRDVTPHTIFRLNEFGKATHQMVDFPEPGYWAPHKGLFVVPIGQVREL